MRRSSRISAADGSAALGLSGVLVVIAGDQEQVKRPGCRCRNRHQGARNFTFPSERGLVYAERVIEEIRFRNLTTDGDSARLQDHQRQRKRERRSLGVAIPPELAEQA